MAEIALSTNGSLTSKQTIEKAIIYSNREGRKFNPGDTIKVYFMPDTTTVPGFKPYTAAQVAVDRTLAEVNASYVGIDPSKYQVILDNVFGPWAKQANISFVRTSNPAEAQIRVGAGVWNGSSVNLPGNGAELINSIFIRPDYYLTLGSPAGFSVGSRETHDLMHEVGHALGLNHPALPQTGGTLPSEFNVMPFTVMTNYGPTIAGYDPSTPSLFDAVGLESLYGGDSNDSPMGSISEKPHMYGMPTRHFASYLHARPQRSRHTLYQPLPTCRTRDMNRTCTGR